MIACIASQGFADRLFDNEIGITSWERDFTETPPPIGPVRPIAEFEPASHVLIRYPLGIPTSLVAQFSNTAQVICIVGSSSVQNQAQSAFQSAGVNLGNVSFLVAPSNSYWTRDFGPWFIVDGNDDISVVDFRYNRPRPNDDAIPSIFAQNFGFTYYGMNLQQTGGNYMTDGLNTAAQTTIAYTENSSLTQAQVNQKMHDYLGISNYYILPDPNNTYIDHIDCWGKFLAPDKVLIRSVPTSHSQYNAIEQTAAFFASQTSAWGYPYKVYRVYTPQNQPYTNSYIFNKKVFVPIMNNSNDAAALQVYRAALPNYEVIGVTGTTSAPWESTDALHCRTHEIPDQEMLYVEHMPLHGVQNMRNYDINAMIKPFSLTYINPDSTFVAYKINQGSWQRSYLTNVNGFDYTTILTGFAPGDTIRYFIHTADASGRSTDHPFTAAHDPHVFVTAPDAVAPEIVHTPYTWINSNIHEYFFYATISDQTGISQAMVEVQIDDQPIQTFEMTDLGENIWYGFAEIYLSTQDQIFRYRITAYDNANPANISTFPEGNGWVQILITPVSNSDQNTPAIATKLVRLYPNPFRPINNGSLSIEYQTEKNQPVDVRIYNVRGQLINSLKSSAKNGGINILTWDGKDKRGNLSTQGIYLIRFEAGSQIQTQKIVLSY